MPSHSDQYPVVMLIPEILLLLLLPLAHSQICKETKKVSRPTRVSYRQSVRRLKHFSCCPNLACDPPVCTKASSREILYIGAELRSEGDILTVRDGDGDSVERHGDARPGDQREVLPGLPPGGGQQRPAPVSA